MTAIDLLATSLNRSDDQPNQELARTIIQSGQHAWVKELTDNLNHRDKAIQSDCIKTLYEIGIQGGAHLIAPYANIFAQLLTSKNNRLVWGAMIALDTIAEVDPGTVFNLLPVLLPALENGSVITIDHGVAILASLSACEEFSSTAFPLLIEQLKRCPAKQFPMYAELSQKVISAQNRLDLISLIETRFQEMERDTQRSRLNKVLKSLSKL